MSDYPVFYGPNAVNENSLITVSSGAAVAYRLYDRDYNAVWKTSGQTSGSSAAIVEILFQENGISTLKTIDTVILQNCNALTAVLEFKLSGGWGGPITLTSANRVGISLKAAFTAKQAYGLRITFSATQTASKEKQIGEVWALRTLFAPQKGFYNYEPSFTPVTINTDTLDGGVKTALVKWSGDRVTRWSANLAFAGLSQIEADTLLAVCALGGFVLYPEPDTLPQAIYAVTAAGGSVSCGYISKVKSGGLSVGFKAEES